MINNDEEIQWAYLLDPTFELVNSAGKPLTDGWLEVYIHGTRNKYYCASDFDGTLHPFKIPLDSLGANIVLASPAHSYDVYVYNRFGSLVMSRYNVVPATGDGSVIKDVVTITSNDGTVDVSSSDQTNWDLSIKNTVDTVVEGLTELIAATGEDLQDQIDNKKDKQSPYSKSGSVTKTITSISQNENGEISVTYSDIDLPPEVPNVDLTSPCGTIDIQTDVDVGSNTKTFKIDVKKANMQYFDGYAAASHYEDRDPGTTFAFGCPMNNWREYKYEGDFITNSWQAAGNMNFLLKPGIYLVTATIRYAMTNASASNTDGYIRIATGSYNGLENGTRYKDWSHEYQMGENTIQMAFVRTVLDGGDYSYIGGNDLYFYPYLPYGVNYAQLDHLQIVKLDSVVGQGGGSGSNTVVTSSDHSVEITASTVGDTTTYDLSVDAASGTEYNAGDAIDITDDTISVKVNPSSGIDIVDDKLVVKVGEGLSIDPASGLVVINSEVTDVVETVEKLKSDLDTQITTNFDMPNISQVYDFADPSVSTLANGACMLCQSFTIPINHELRTTTDDADTPTLFGIYAQQNFAHNIMLALYEYTYAAEGEEHGSSTYVGDTGPVNVVQGVNEYPLKNRNPSITELRSDKVYYATLYLPNAARVNGLLLAGCPGYGSQSIPAEPRLSCAVENITWDGQELDMSDPTTTLNHYQEVIIPGQPVYYQYYIGPWQSGYNERQTAPRFYMQIRNGEFNVPVVPTAPFNDLGDALPRGTANQSNIPSFTPSQANSAFRDVTPLLNVTITSFEWIDGMQNAAGWAAANCVYDSGFANNLSGVSNSVVDLGQVVTGEYPGYAHRITFTTPLTLTAGTTYRFLCGCTNGSPYFKVWLDPTDVIHVGNNGWYVVDTNVLRIDHQMGMYNKLYDNQNNHYVI